jgi:hypothetical protein
MQAPPPTVAIAAVGRKSRFGEQRGERGGGI